MNFVGHLYLSGDNEKIKVGNFIGDYVKGKQLNKFSDEIKKGIELHRYIDRFTDSHKSFLEAKKFFKKDYDKYSSVVVDIVFDYILTKNWKDWHSAPLEIYTKEQYRIFIKHFIHLPLRVKEFLPFMIKSDRLYTYSTIDGVERTLAIMANHTSLPSAPHSIALTIKENEDALKSLFYNLFSDIIIEVNRTFSIKTPAEAATQIEMHRTLRE